MNTNGHEDQLHRHRVQIYTVQENVNDNRWTMVHDDNDNDNVDWDGNGDDDDCDDGEDEMLSGVYYEMWCWLWVELWVVLLGEIRSVMRVFVYVRTFLHIFVRS